MNIVSNHNFKNIYLGIYFYFSQFVLCRCWDDVVISYSFIYFYFSKINLLKVKLIFDIKITLDFICISNTCMMHLPAPEKVGKLKFLGSNRR